MSHVFIDESGDAGFKFDKGSSNYFVVAAVIFDDDREVEKISAVIKSFKAKIGFKEYREFKFHTLRKNFRVAFLKVINPCTFSVYYVAIDKRYWKREKNNKTTFYIYAVKMLLTHIGNIIRDAKIRLDGGGGTTFQMNFISQMRKHLNRSNRKVIHNFYFTDSKDNSLIQLADMIAGTLRRSCEGDTKDADVYKNIIKKHIRELS